LDTGKKKHNKGTLCLLHISMIMHDIIREMKE